MKTKEPIQNIAHICKNCGDERHKEWQQRNQHTVIHIDDWCKIAFTEGGQGEHMFVKVHTIKVYPEGITYIGKLDNDPLYLKNIKYEDEVSFNFSQIEQLYRNGELI